jgi:nitrite reductase/ring-hydroxylating ferredoxin subunit/uncharacterized membrane protein
MALPALVEQALDRLPVLDQIGDAGQTLIGSGLQRGGSPAKLVKDLLNGVWFRHPLHPALTDVPIGSWTCATLLDAASAGDSRLRPAADTLVGVGCLGALGAALSGVADWQDTYGHERRVGVAHALLNVGALTLFSTSWFLRRGGSRSAGLAASAAGYGLALASSYLGGHLVFRLGTQVNRNAWTEAPEDWTPAITEAELGDNQLVHASAGGLSVLLVRQHGRVYAMGDVCSHAGGPLHEGTLDGRSVICPWHGSQFDLADGNILHGPATAEALMLETRIQDGHVQVRRRTAV